MNTFKGILIGMLVGCTFGAVGVFFFLGTFSQDGSTFQVNNIAVEEQKNDEANIINEDITQELTEDILSDLDKELQNITNTEDLLSKYKSNDKIVEEIIANDIHPEVDDRKWFLEGLMVCNEIITIDFHTDDGKNDFWKLMGSDEIFTYMEVNNISSYNECVQDDKCDSDEVTDLDFAMYDYIKGNLGVQDTIDRIEKQRDQYKEEQLINYILIPMVVQKLQKQGLDSNFCENEFLKYNLEDFS